MALLHEAKHPSVGKSMGQLIRMTEFLVTDKVADDFGFLSPDRDSGRAVQLGQPTARYKVGLVSDLLQRKPSPSSNSSAFKFGHRLITAIASRIEAIEVLWPQTDHRLIARIDCH